MRWFVPGRLEVLGKHTDYAGGPSLLAAVDRGVVVDLTDGADAIVVESAALPGRLELRPGVDPGLPGGHWGHYVQSVLDRLHLNFGELRPAQLSVESDLPLASGMSSSSALVAGGPARGRHLRRLGGPHRHAVLPRGAADRVHVLPHRGAADGPDARGLVFRRGGLGRVGREDRRRAGLLQRGLAAGPRAGRGVELGHRPLRRHAGRGAGQQRGRPPGPGGHLRGRRLAGGPADQALGNQIPETNRLQSLARELGAPAASGFGAGFGGSVWALVPTVDADAFAASWLERYLAEYPGLAGAASTLVTRPGRPAHRR